MSNSNKLPLRIGVGIILLNNEKEMIASIIKHPRILERPIMVTETKAKIGRPPESLLTIL